MLTSAINSLVQVEFVVNILFIRNVLHFLVNVGL